MHDRRQQCGLALGAFAALAAMVLQPGSGKAGPYLSAVSDTTVKTTAGALVGARHDGVDSYLGVPYATAERFMAPKPVTAWQGVRPAVTYGENCMAPMGPTVAKDELFNPHRAMPMNEACQFLNIWAKSDSGATKRPVMVWLHGGGYTNGSATEQVAYDGENLARKGDVVVVTLNHRLNVLGFLDLSAYGPQYKHSANASIADLVMALQWVRDNIEAFGGDPANVTIFGQSGGGSKVRTLMGTPAAKGLFAKAIVQSGASSAPVIPQADARKVTEATLAKLDLKPDQVGELTTMPYARLLEASTQAMAELKTGGMANPRWAPVVDGDYLPRDPVGHGWVEQARDIPLLIGTVLNEQETVTKISPNLLYADNKNEWSEARAKAKLSERFGDKAEAVGKAFLEAYPGKKLADAAYVDVTGRPGTLKNTRLKAQQNGAPVYSYVFTWESPAMGGIGMSWHCSEIPHVFANAALVATATGGGADAIALSDKMSQAWINFARAGDPNHPGLARWEPYTVDKGATMIFDNTSELRFNHDLPLLKAAGVM